MKKDPQIGYPEFSETPIWVEGLRLSALGFYGWVDLRLGVSALGFRVFGGLGFKV